MFHYECASLSSPLGNLRLVEKGSAATLRTSPGTWKHELRSHCVVLADLELAVQTRPGQASLELLGSSYDITSISHQALTIPSF